MGSIIDQIRRKMESFPEARVEHDFSSITYLPDKSDGFMVRLIVLKRGRYDDYYSIYYNGSHEEFWRPDHAVLAFGFGLSNGCRLREFTRNGDAYKWIVDVTNFVEWKPYWEIVRFSAGFWKVWVTPTVRLLQNHLIDLSDSGGDSAAERAVSRPPRGTPPSLSKSEEPPGDDRRKE